MLGPWRSERLIYRAVEEDDEPFLLTLSNDPEAYLNAAPFLPTPRSKKKSTKYREFLESNMLAAIICLPPPTDQPSDAADSTAKPTPIGVIHLGSIEPPQIHHRRSGIGITIDRSYQGQGFGSEAIRWICHWGFVYAGLHRIEISAYSINEGAVKLYVRLGFTIEGRARDWGWCAGRWTDMVMFGMLEDEWREKYGNGK